MNLARAISAKSPISLLVALLVLFTVLVVPFTLGDQPTNTTPTNLTNTTIQTEQETNYTAVFSPLYQEAILIGEPVSIYQTIDVTNHAQEVLSATLQLADYVDTVYLEEALSISVASVGEESELETPTVLLNIPPGETREYILTYTFTPVYKEVTCEQTTLADILPQDATQVESQLAIAETIQHICHVRIHHEGDIHYYDITVPLDEFEPSTIESIYYVEGDTHLTIDEEGNIALLE